MINAKKRAYAKARAAGLAKKKAAIHAGYSEATASQAASRLERDPSVIRIIQSLQSPQGERSEPEKAEIAKAVESPGYGDPLGVMNQIMMDDQEDPDTRLKAADKLAAYTLLRPRDKPKRSKEQERQDNASKASGGIFGDTGLRAVK